MGRFEAAFDAALDVVIVLAFVAIGRSTHRHGLSLGGMADTAWPFLCGVALGWALTTWRRGRERAGSLVSGLWVSSCTVAAGMVLRVVSGQGTATAFVFVALAFLGGAMLAWRAVLISARARHRPSPAPRGS